MTKKDNFLMSALPMQLVDGGDVIVVGGGSGQGGFNWAGIECTSIDVTGDNWGDIYDSSHNLWANGPSDPNTPGKAWTLRKDMEYLFDGEWISLPEGSMVDFDTLSRCLETMADCGDDLGGGGF